MRTSIHPGDLADCPVEELAISAPPARWHGLLQELGTHCRDGSWVITGARDVEAALGSAALSVVPAAGNGGPAAELIASMARFSDGAEHTRRRDLLVSLLPPVPRVAAAAGARASDYLRRRSAAFDIMPMARHLPAEVLALSLGLSPAAADRAATLTGILCDAVTPTLRPGEGTEGAGDAAAVTLAGVITDDLGAGDTERITAAISLLFQARDATAALIGSTILARRGDDTAVPAAQRIDDVLRHDAPVQCTRRTAIQDTAVGAARIPAGAPVWIFVATAERGRGRPATFGSGPHGCPAAAQATAIARQVAAVLLADGWRPVPGQRVELEPRPNVRVPARVLVARP
jgi:cytochrome P450